jgi:DNA-binding MarR family transcriptional regulator
MTNASTPTPTLTGQVIGQTERAIRALLDLVLTENEIAFESWVGIRLVATTRPPRDRAAFAAEMANGLKIDDSAAASVLRDLVTDGLLGEADGVISLTPAGRTRYERIAARVGDITEQLYGGVPPEELEITSRVLSTVRLRADAMRARS